MVYDMPPNDAGQHERDLRAPKSQNAGHTEQRDRAESWLKEAYADGRIGESEFDQRIGQVLTAVTRKELNEAFYGLVQIPTSSRALGVHPAYQPLVRPETRQQAGRGVAGVAHFSVFFLWLLVRGWSTRCPPGHTRAGSGQIVQLPVDLFDRVRAGRHLGRCNGP